MFHYIAIRAFIVVGLALSAGACSTDPEALRAASDAYDSGGLLGAFVAATPEAVAERKRKARLLGAYRAKTCSAVAPAGTPTHQGCVLQLAEEEARKAAAVSAMRASQQPVMCHKVGNMVSCY